MKPTGLTIVFSVVLIMLSVGTFLMPAATAAIIADTVDFEPKRLDLDNPDELITAIITFPVDKDETEQRVVEINTTTVLLEGTVPVVADSNSTGDKPWNYRCDFDGSSVRNLIWLKIYHVGMEPNPQGNYVVELTITGNLYDGTPFTGTGHIQVKPKKTSSSPPPPPPT